MQEHDRTTATTEGEARPIPVFPIPLGTPDAILVLVGGRHVSVLADPACPPETVDVVLMAAQELVDRAEDPLRGVAATCRHERDERDDGSPCACEQAARWGPVGRR